MRIERISDNQIKIFLDRKDLEARNISISELAYGSEKTQEFFKEVMIEASDKYDFQTNDAPLIIEAVPINIDSIVIIVTKVDSKESNKRLNFMTEQMKEYKEKFDEMRDDKIEDNNSLNNTDEERDYHINRFLSTSNDVLVFSFDELDKIIELSSRIHYIYFGESMVYKYEEKFFLILERLENSYERNDELDILEGLLGEYGEQHISSKLSKHFLMEHGQEIIKEHAIEKLVLLA